MIFQQFIMHQGQTSFIKSRFHASTATIIATTILTASSVVSIIFTDRVSLRIVLSSVIVILLHHHHCGQLWKTPSTEHFHFPFQKRALNCSCQMTRGLRVSGIELHLWDLDAASKGWSTMTNKWKESKLLFPSSRSITSNKSLAHPQITQANMAEITETRKL